MEENNPLIPYNQQPISAINWALYIFVSSIPVIGFIVLLVWAFGDGNIHRKFWAKGMLLITFLGLIIVFFLVFFLGLGTAVMGALNNK